MIERRSEILNIIIDRNIWISTYIKKISFIVAFYIWDILMLLFSFHTRSYLCDIFVSSILFLSLYSKEAQFLCMPQLANFLVCWWSRNHTKEEASALPTKNEVSINNSDRVNRVEELLKNEFLFFLKYID